METTYTGITGSSRLYNGTQRPDFPTICGHPKLWLHQHWDDHQDVQLQSGTEDHDEDTSSTRLYCRHLLTPYPSPTNRRSKNTTDVETYNAREAIMGATKVL